MAVVASVITPRIISSKSRVEFAAALIRSSASADSRPLRVCSNSFELTMASVARSPTMSSSRSSASSYSCGPIQKTWTTPIKASPRRIGAETAVWIPSSSKKPGSLAGSFCTSAK